jgi:mycothiol synthase
LEQSAGNNQDIQIVRRRSDAAVVSLRPDLSAQVVRPSRVRPVQPGEIDQALALFLADGSEGRQQMEDKLFSFKQLARREHYDLSRQMVGLYQGQIVHACLFVSQPGRSAFIFTSPVRSQDSSGSNLSSLAGQTLRSTWQWALHEGASLIQILTEPEDVNRQDLCRRSGFRKLTDLIYLFRIADPSPAVRPHLSDSMRWLTYTPERSDLFGEVIRRTYEDSQDCPELSDLRDIEDVLASHQGAGHFKPAWWRLLLQDDEPLGVLIVSPLRSGDVLELTYMGLAPSARGKGLGKLMLQEAFYLCGTLPLTLAVDSRNQAAYRLYTGAGFQVVLRRTAFILSSRWPGV